MTTHRRRKYCYLVTRCDNGWLISTEELYVAIVYGAGEMGRGKNR